MFLLTHVHSLFSGVNKRLDQVQLDDFKSGHIRM